MKLPFLLARAFNAPLMIEPRKLASITAVLGERFGLDFRGPADWPGAAPALEAQAGGGERKTRAGLRLTPEGVAVLPITGPLVHRRMPMDAESGGPTAYKSLAFQLKDAVEDPGVRAILLEVDSPGGEAGGVFQLADWIYQARQTKPIWAIANEGAYSAAYALASAASRLLLPATAGVGSIGVFWQHMSQVKFDQAVGLEYLVIQAGARKNDFNPHFEVDSEAVAWAQAEVERTYGVFVAAVARNRSLDEQAVRDTEAGLIFGPAAVEAGLADGIAGLDQALADLTDYATNRLGGAQGVSPAAGPTVTRKEEADMTAEVQKPAAAASNTPAPETQAQAQAARDEAVQAERQRVAAILALPEAKGREALAQELVSQGASVEAAQKLLAAAPAQAAETPLDRAMRGVPNPSVGAGGGAEEGRPPRLAAVMARRLGLTLDGKEVR
ncbi:MAG: S49 family peptidase [Desulfarculus sp.]|nr:MAG: S49 family peptidase [Desulfarculus sp.]